MTKNGQNTRAKYAQIARADSQNPNSTKSFRRRFTPLIASSLALALGASVAVANPVFTSGTADKSNEFNTLLNWTVAGSMYQTNIQNININFGNSGSSFQAPTLNGTTLESNIGDPRSAEFTIRSDKGLQLGDGNGSLTINTATNWLEVPKGFTLDLSQAVGTSFKGNIKLVHGVNGNPPYKGKVIKAYFGGDLDGSILAESAYGQTSTFTFKGKTANITGKVSINNNAASHSDAIKSDLTISANSLTIGKGVSLIATTYNQNDIDPLKWNTPKATFNLSGDNRIGKVDANNSIWIQSSRVYFNLAGNSSLTFDGNIALTNNDKTVLSIDGKDSALTINGNIDTHTNGNGATTEHKIDINVKSLTLNGNLTSNPTVTTSSNFSNKITLNGGDSKITGNVFTHNTPINFTLNGGSLSIGGNISHNFQYNNAMSFTLNGTNATKPTTLILSGANNSITTLTATGANNALNLANTAKTTSIKTLNIDNSHLNINNSNTTADSLTITNLSLSNGGNLITDGSLTITALNLSSGGRFVVTNTTPKLTKLNVAGTGSVIRGNVTANIFKFAKFGNEIRYDGNLMIRNIDVNSAQGTFTAINGGGVNNYLAISNGSNEIYTFQATEKKIEGGTIVAATKKSSNITIRGGYFIESDGSNGTSIELEAIDDQTHQDWLVWKVKSDVNNDSTETKPGDIRAESSKDISASFLNVYLANFNSLNKRMGELRENKNGQGAWGRIFNGQENNKFSNSSTNFTTIQAGYDYAFGLGEGVTNYLGAALSYGFGSSGFNKNYNGRSISDMTSHLVEFALYNSYVQDEGWFNDTIIKFGSLMNNIDANQLKVKTNSFAFTFSDEVGYRFKLGSEKEWFIDPQFELGMGHLAGADFKDAKYLATADSMFVLRTRLGASAGYDFKKLLNGDTIKASAYVGLFAEIDSFNGGNVTFANLATQKTSFKSTDARGVINYGGNVAVKDNIRVYLDMEHSFGGQISTDYKINAGVRYSFGEKTQFLDVKAQEKKDEAKKKEETPIKLKEEEKKNTQEQTKDVKKEEAKAQEKQTTSETSKNEKAEAKKTESKKADAKAGKKQTKKQTAKKGTAKKQPAKKQAQAKKGSEAKKQVKKAEANKAKSANKTAQTEGRKDSGWGWW